MRSDFLPGFLKKMKLQSWSSDVGVDPELIEGPIDSDPIFDLTLPRRDDPDADAGVLEIS